MTWGVVGGALMLVFCALLLRNFSFKGAPVFAVICSVVILTEASDGLHKISSSVFSIMNESGSSEVVLAALKILGVGYLFGLCADICRDLSENGIAKAVEVAGRVEIIVIVLPFLMDIVNLGVELL